MNVTFLSILESVTEIKSCTLKFYHGVFIVSGNEPKTTTSRHQPAMGVPRNTLSFIDMPLFLLSNEPSSTMIQAFPSFMTHDSTIISPCVVTINHLLQPPATPISSRGSTIASLLTSEVYGHESLAQQGFGFTMKRDLTGDLTGFTRTLWA